MFSSLGDRIDRNPKEIFQSSIKLPRLGLSSVKALHPTMEINSTCGKLCSRSQERKSDHTDNSRISCALPQEHHEFPPEL